MVWQPLITDHGSLLDHLVR